MLAVGLSAELVSHAAAQTAPQPIQFPPITDPTEQQRGPLPVPLPPTERVGFAVVGLGRLSLEELLPALSESKKARLAALVSGDANKAHRVAQQYDVPNRAFTITKRMTESGTIPTCRVIYIVLPNSMHLDTPYAARERGNILYAKSRWRHRRMNAKR